jgi:CRP/FNR family cyclic AMP-dependent transcriptional regulator
MVRQSETLSRVPIFATLSRAVINALDTRCTWRRVVAKQWVIDYRDEGINVFFVVSGSVRVLIYAKPGSEVILADLDSGEFFGELAAIDGKPRSASVLAVTDAIIAIMPGRVFMDIMRDHSAVAVELLKLLAARVRSLDNRVLEYSTLNVRHRVYSELLRLARPDPTNLRQAIISPPLTQSEIAARVSTHREAVAREMKLLEREKILLRRRGAIVLTDVPKLVDRLQQL